MLEAIAEGDLTKEANQDYMGDFHTIKKSLDSILGALNQTMGQCKNVNLKSNIFYSGNNGANLLGIIGNIFHGHAQLPF